MNHHLNNVVNKFLAQIVHIKFHIQRSKKRIAFQIQQFKYGFFEKDAKKRERGVHTLHSKNVKGKPVFPTHTNAFTVLGCSNTGSCQNFPLLIEFKAII